MNSASVGGGRWASHGRGAFTLIELLVVIAVGILLAALIWAGTRNAFAAAANVRCQTNLRAVAQACQLYGADHGGWIPRWRPNSGSWWFTRLNPYLEWYNEATGEWVGGRCEARPQRDTRVVDYAMNAVIGSMAVGDSNQDMYYGDIRVVRDGVAQFWRMDWLAHPAEGFLAADRGHGATYRIATNATDPGGGDTDIGYFHGGRAMAVFADGHIRRLAVEDIPPREARFQSHPRHREYKAFWLPHEM